MDIPDDCSFGHGAAGAAPHALASSRTPSYWLRLASPTRTHARHARHEHETEINFPVGLPPQPPISLLFKDLNLGLIVQGI